MERSGGVKRLLESRLEMGASQNFGLASAVAQIFQSAVSQLPACKVVVGSADWKSAIQQVGNLRYFSQCQGTRKIELRPRLEIAHEYCPFGGEPQLR
ncbi:MAG: hypothetical protein C5B50_21940 [Verrucomicrobia bacterium]|nr:MAG: hypothetical protein C5B50_21940 [Verrucomicrobiota bacterium]